MKKRGFTLIELLVVIAIIGILATIILISIANARPRALRASALESLNRVISTANICRDGGESNQISSFAITVEPENEVCLPNGPAQARWPGKLAGYNSYRAVQGSAGITTLRGGTTGTGFANISVSSANSASGDIEVTHSGEAAIGVK